MRINENYLNLDRNYLFAEIDKKVTEFKKSNPDKNVISLGIGDVTRPLPNACLSAMHSAVDEMGNANTFRGYGPYEGYMFLREKIAENDYRKNGIEISPSEIFVSDGAKSDTGNIGDIFSTDCSVLITDPVYPVYRDTNVMSGRKVQAIPCRESDGFAPVPPDCGADIVYLCSPNNPTGSAMTKLRLRDWVNWAVKFGAVILYDAAYEHFITEKDVPHSIYEIDGAKSCAIEFRSFSKTAGFTGTRCGFCVIPRELSAQTSKGKKIFLRDLWLRRQSTKYNGTSYIIQRGAEAVYSEQGMSEVEQTISFYLENARIIREGLKSAGLECSGGVNAPYIWLKCPRGVGSWDLFDDLLSKCAVVGTPGAGFGKMGEGYFRLTSFGTRENTIDAVKRIVKSM